MQTILYYNIYYNIESILKERNKIYFLYRNIKTKKLNIKLNYKKLKLFKIKKIKNLINYKLILLKIINIYLIFYISFLELILLRALSAPITEIQLINPDTEYKIEIILNYKIIKGRIKYLIK